MAEDAAAVLSSDRKIFPVFPFPVFLHHQFDDALFGNGKKQQQQKYSRDVSKIVSLFCVIVPWKRKNVGPLLLRFDLLLRKLFVSLRKINILVTH